MKTKKSFPAKIIKIVFVITLILLVALSSAQESAQEKTAGEDAFEEGTGTEETIGGENPEERTATEEPIGGENPEERTATEEPIGGENPEEGTAVEKVAEVAKPDEGTSGDTTEKDEKQTPTIWQNLAPYGALLFGTIALLIEFLLAKEKTWDDRRVYGWDADDIIRFLGLTVIITLAVFLGLAGMSMESEIFTAIIGFLAAVAGYLAGNIRQGSQQGTPGTEKKTVELDTSKRVVNPSPDPEPPDGGAD